MNILPLEELAWTTRKSADRCQESCSTTVFDAQRNSSRIARYLTYQQATTVCRTKGGISPILGSAPKKYASRYYQLKVGHGAVGTFLARIQVIETPECWWCGVPEQTVEHLYTRCRKWRKQRRKLVRELEKEGVKWQPRVERRWLADLLGDEKAVAPLLKFLKTTGIGGREGARERGLEWEWKNDQESENLLG